MKASLKKKIARCFLVYIALGIPFLIVEEIQKSRAEWEVKVTIFEPRYDIVYIQDTHKIKRLWKAVNKYRKFNKVIWFRLPGGKDKCVVSIYDEKKEVTVDICKSEKLGWYLMYDVSSPRNPPAYYKLSEEEAKELVEEILRIGKVNHG